MREIEEKEHMRNKWCLTADDASRVVAAAKVEAQKNNWNVTIAVVDDGGFLLHLERMDDAPAQSATIATAKAWTAAATRRPTKTLQDMIKEHPAVATFPGRLPVQGGLPISYQGECVGAVGVSGVKSFEDEQIGKAGLQALGGAIDPSRG
jgi:glc operon protein GlcG